MRRLLTLTAVFALMSLVLAGTATAKSVSFANLVKLSGDTAFFQTTSSSVVLKNLRTGTTRTVTLPTSVRLAGQLLRANSHALVYADHWNQSQPRRLSIVGTNSLSRLLGISDMRNGGCNAYNYFVPLQLDSRDAVSALTWDAARGCGADPSNLSVTRYYADGRFAVIPLPSTISQRIVYGPEQLVMRGNDLLIRAAREGDDSVVYNIATGSTVWQGNLPPATAWAMPLKNTIWTSQDYLGHSSRTTFFNFVTGEEVSFKIPHPRGASSCGRFTLLVNLRYAVIYNERGRRVYKKTAAKGSSFGRRPVMCSDRWAYFSISRDGSPDGQRLIDLTKLH